MRRAKLLYQPPYSISHRIPSDGSRIFYVERAIDDGFQSQRNGSTSPMMNCILVPDQVSLWPSPSAHCRENCLSARSKRWALVHRNFFSAANKVAPRTTMTGAPWTGSVLEQRSAAHCVQFLWATLAWNTCRPVPPRTTTTTAFVRTIRTRASRTRSRYKSFANSPRTTCSGSWRSGGTWTATRV